ncbi:MAG: outer membrane protein assembly factor BamA, partial [Candidatus Cloacimonetes bacterium]|nr:outer membrane protein assembly factor BamA [Candidatus Cloacimonadota bacterium]
MIWKVRLSLLTLLLLMSITLFSQTAVILDLQITGNERVDRNLILSTSGLKIGDMFTPEIVGSAIKNLYQLYVFEDVNIDVEEINRGIRIHIIVEELPVVQRFSYEGSKAISKSKLEEVGILRIGTNWSPIVQNENSRRILAEYKSKGFNLAQLDYQMTQMSALTDKKARKQAKKDAKAGIDTRNQLGERIDVRVKVTEGKKVKVRRVLVEGNEHITSKKIIKKMKTRKSGFFRSGKFEEERYTEDQKRIIDYYHKLGYIDARIVRVEEEIENKRFLILTLHIEEGEKFYFGSVDIVGNHHFEKQELLDKFTMSAGDVFNMDKFDKQLRSVGAMYYEEGYIYLQYDQKINRDGNRVNILLDIEENTRARIHKIHISGNTKTKEKVIRRQLTIAPGDYFKQSRIIRSQQNVYNLGFFEPDMELDYAPINREGDVDLFLKVTDRSSGSANVGLGYNSRDKLLGTMSLALNNAFGNSWQTSINWETSGSHNNVELGFVNPYLYDTDVLFGTSLYNTRRRWSSANYNVQTMGAGVRFGYPIKAIDYSRISLGYSIGGREYSIRNRDVYYSHILDKLDAAGWQTTSSVNMTLSRDSRDNVFFPTTGSRIVLHSELAGGPVGGDFNYFKQVSEVSWFTPLFLSTALRSKWRVGYITGYGSHSEVPPDERFLLGGTGASGIRGYADRSIGPLDGGTREVLFATEVGIPVASDQIIGLLFLDTGNCYNRFSDFNFKDFET